MTASSHLRELRAIPDAAWKFIKFDAGKKWAVERAKVANWMPMRNDLADDPAIKADPMLAQFVQIGNNARSYPLPSPDLGRDRGQRHRRRRAEGAARAGQDRRDLPDLDARLTKKLRDV